MEPPNELGITDENLATRTTVENPVIDFREHILTLVEKHVNENHAPKPFAPGKTYIPASGKVVGAHEALNMVETALNLDLTITGEFNPIFERLLAEHLGVARAMTCNSGSSANLLAVTALCEYAELEPGDEVICSAAGFPTTVNPIMQNGLVPVFVDAKLPYYNIDADKIEAAISGHSVAIMLDHTMGNPCDMDKIGMLADKYDLYMIEDCCDSIGSKYYRGIDAACNHVVGSFGDIGTASFYPAHHLTTGEGGAVFSNNRDLMKIVESLSNWGRDCVCPPNHDNVCGKRFDQQHGGLPHGFDHKYVFARMGYNLKMTDMQAACGVAQMGRLASFHQLRKLNFKYLWRALEDLQDHLILPEAMPNSAPSWFCFPVTLKHGERLPLLKYLEAKRIGTRLLFGGNLTRQPYMQGRNFRVSENLDVTDRIMRDTFCLGIYPGITNEMLDYVAEVLHTYWAER